MDIEDLIRRLSGDEDILRELERLVEQEFLATRRPTPQRRVLPHASADDYWAPHGEAVSIKGYEIEGGLLYIGRGLPAATGRGVEPALIDPRLSVDRKAWRAGESSWGYVYARSYRDLSASQRAEYLAWLADGRRDPEAPMWVVELYACGLERRLLADRDRRDADAILAEADRLVELYGRRHSYHYGRGISEFARVARIAVHGIPRYCDGPPPDGSSSWDGAPRLRIGLGQLAAERRPLPPEWALAWLRASRKYKPSTVEVRCREEWERLFALAYRETYGDGIIIKPGKRRLKESYYPLSPTFGGGRLELPVGDLPDVGGLRATTAKLDGLGWRARVELESYSRWIGQNPDGKGSLAGIARLPAALLDGEPDEAISELERWIVARLDAADPAALDVSELAAHLMPGGRKRNLTKAEAAALAKLLAARGYGLEPDARRATMFPTEGPVVLYRLAAPERVEPTGPTGPGLAVIQLGHVVAEADGPANEQEREALFALADAVPVDGASARERLRAHLAWRLARPARATTVGLRAAFERLDARQRRDVGRAAVAVAAADGPVSPKEIAALEKAYRLLGLPEGELYAAIHAGSVADAPITVRAPGERPGFVIPPQAEPEGGRVALDPRRVEAGLVGSAAVSALLGEIFAEDDADTPAPPSPPESEGIGVAGLDAAHAALLRALAERTGWTRAAFDAAARERGLLPEGALDALNDAALERAGEPVAEPVGDAIVIDAEILEEILS